MRLLFVNACPRAQALSRTYQLAEHFLSSLKSAHPELRLERVDLSQEAIRPFTGEDVARRERLIDDEEWAHPMFRWARQFHDADMLVVAAPYWDFSFPSILKVYIENIFVRNLNFYYTQTGPVGLAKAGRMVYITTAGSAIAPNMDHGGGYMKTVATILGIPEFDALSAQGLDIEGADVEGILRDAFSRAEALAAIM